MEEDLLQINPLEWITFQATDQIYAFCEETGDIRFILDKDLYLV